MQLFLMLFLHVLVISCSTDEKLTVDQLGDENVAVIHLGPILNDFNIQQVRQSLEDLPGCMQEAPGFAQISLTYGEDEVPVEVVVKILEDENGFFSAYDEALKIPILGGAVLLP